MPIVPPFLMMSGNPDGTSFKEECLEWLAVFKTEVMCAILPSSVLCILVQTIIHEWPRTIWKPVERDFEFVSQECNFLLLTRCREAESQVLRWNFDDQRHSSERDGAVSP